MRAEPPVYDVNPDDLDDDQHPTGAWPVGERLDDTTAAALRRLIDEGHA